MLIRCTKSRLIHSSCAVFLATASLLLSAVHLARAQSDTRMEDLDEQDRLYLQRLERSRENRGEPTGEEGEREEIVRAFLAEADELIRDRNFAAGSSEHYRVLTDDPRLDAAAAVGLLESFHAFFEDSWTGRHALAPREEPARAYLFYSFYKYNKLLTGKERFGEFRPSGHYRRFLDVIVVHTDSVAADGLADVLVHEAAHQLVEQRLFGTAAPRSLWIAEGLAGYYGYTARRADGSFEAGAIGGKATALIRGSKGSADSRSAESRLRSMKGLLGRGDGWSLDGLLRTSDPAVFYGELAEEHYAASWLLVHFLLHGEGGVHSDAFVRYLDREAAGEGGTEALLEELGMDLGALDAAFARHVRRLRPR